MLKVFYGNENKVFSDNYTAVGLGNFDGLHVGHMALVNTLISEAKINGFQSVIYTFTKHPENILRKKLFTSLLTTEQKRIQLLSETALDCVYFDEFNESYSRMSPEDFVKKVLLEKLNARLVIAGFNYHFGYMGQGDAQLLKAMGKKFGFNVIIIPPVMVNNEVASSTAIRKYVRMGKMENVFRLLGRHYSITGVVTEGKCRGRRIGFPTANIHPEKYLVLPKNGVYITKTLYEGEFYNSLTNIGSNPTFGDMSEVSVETHIINFDKNIYRSNIEVFFLSHLRNEIKFKDARELTEQIQKDIQTARNYFGLS